MSAKKKIKVLECIRQGQIGGGESHLLSVVENLDKTRFDPIVLSFTDGPMIGRLKEMGIKTHIIHTEKPFDIRKWSAVKNLIRQQEIDLVHAHGTRACSNILWAAKSVGIPLVYTIHGWSFHPDQNPWLRRLRIWGENWLTSKADINISVSASNKQTGKTYIRDFESVVINNGINQEKFCRGNVFRNIREELGIPTNAVLALFLARFTAHKQPLPLIRAFKKALPAAPDLYLLMVGDGDQKQEAIQLVDSLCLADRVLFQPFRQDVPDILAAADLFVLPSLWEGFPIGLIEAMAMGKAIIATNVDGTKEVVQDGVNGLLIEAGNIPALTDALVQMASKESTRSALGDEAWKTVLDQFNAVNMTRKIEEIYIDLAERGK